MVEEFNSNDIQFDKQFSFWGFLKFVSPSILSMLFISFYTIVDGIFISRYAGPNPLAAINIVLPLINLCAGFGVMMACGGSSIISRLMGENKLNKANDAFSFICYFSLIISLIFTIIGIFYIKPILFLLGASDVLMPYALIYARGIILVTPFFVTKILLEYFVRSDGDYNFSLLICIAGGIINIVLDYVFIKIFAMGIFGAILATCIGIVFSSFLGIYYFFYKQKALKFNKSFGDFKLIYESCFNGSSEMVSELSTGVTTVLFNFIALKYGNELGVSSLSILLYSHFFMISVYLGLSFGAAPIFSYNLGSCDFKNIKRIFYHCIKFILASSIFVFFISFLFSSHITSLFVNMDDPMFLMTNRGLKLFSFTFLFVGFNVFISSFFTSLGEGKLSALLSFCRTFVFVVIMALILPRFLGLDGLWLVLPIAEFCCFFLSVFYIKNYRIKNNSSSLSLI